MVLDPVIDGEVDGPRWEITEDGGTESAIHASDAIMLEDRFDGG